MSDNRTGHDFDQAPERPSRPRGRRPVSLQRTPPERRSFNGALVASVLLHGLLLSQLVGEGQGVPGLVLPWQERRAVVPDIQTVLVPPQPAPAASAPPPSAAVDVQRASIRSAPVETPVPNPPAPPAPRPPEPAVAEAGPVNLSPPPPPPPPPPHAEVPARTSPPPPSPPPPVLTAEPTDVPTPVVPVAPEPVLAASAVEPSASSPDTVTLAQREAALEAQRLEAERQEAVRQQAAAQLEAQRQEAARQAAARAEAARLEAVRLETERQEAARLDAQRQEAARQAAARAEAARQAAAQQLEVQRQEAARQAAIRAEAARLEAERQEAARQEAARQEVARAQAAQQEAAAKREAVLRAIGRQLDEERARRDAAANAAPSPSGALPLSLSTARRARLFGHTDPNADLVAYAQAWALKIQLNTLPDQVRAVARRPHTPATVTVALRRDGSVESVTFVVSSGMAEIDDAIRRIIDAQRPYPAFAPNLAREFDVIEIRRTWHFDAAVRLH